MKTLKNIFATLTLITIAAVSVNAQTSATASDVDARATIIQPIAIANSTALNFGVLVPSGTDGEVTINSAGTERNPIDVGLIDQQDGFTAAAFNVTGQLDYNFSITLPGTIQLTGAGEPMDVKDFTASIPTTGNKIITGGTPFTMGATIEVAGNQTAGTYAGTFDVTVAYE